MIVNILWVKGDFLQGQMVKVIRMMETLGKNQKEMLEIKNTNRC